LGIAANDLKKAKDDIELKQRRVDSCERQLKHMRERRKFNHFLNTLTQNNIEELGAVASALEDAEDEMVEAHSTTTKFCLGKMIIKAPARKEWTMDGDEDLTAQPEIYVSEETNFDEYVNALEELNKKAEEPEEERAEDDILGKV
jgi:hypothetical protein